MLAPGLHEGPGLSISVSGDVECGEKIDHEPQMHIMADLSNKKFSLLLSQCNVELYGLPCFSAKRDASLLYTTVAIKCQYLLQLKKNDGVGGAVFYFPHTLFMCPLLHLSSCSIAHELRWNFDSKVRKSLKTLTSKNALCQFILPQKLCATDIKLRHHPLGWQFCAQTGSLVTGCRLGSVPTL